MQQVRKQTELQPCMSHYLHKGWSPGAPHLLSSRASVANECVIWIQNNVSVALKFVSFDCRSVYYEVWRVENEGIESPKPRSGESKIEVWRVQIRALGSSLTALEAAGRMVRFRGVLQPSWERFG